MDILLCVQNFMDVFWVSLIICGCKCYRKNSCNLNNQVGISNYEWCIKGNFLVVFLIFSFKVEDFENFFMFVSGSYGVKMVGIMCVF